MYFVTGAEKDSGFYKLAMENIKKRKIDLWYSSPAKHLVRDADGKVIRIQIYKDGALKNIRAKGGVAPATDGFENDGQMIANYMQRSNVYCRAAVYNEGGGVRMGQEAGSDLWHMSDGAAFMWGYQVEGEKTCTSPTKVADGILVGPVGSRFMNGAAASRHGRISIGGSYIMMPVPNPTWLIVGSDKIADKLCASFSDGNKDEIAGGTVITAATVNELASKIGADAKVLAATFNKYNAAFDAGKDADYERPIATMSPVRKAPFYALKLGCAMLNTQGGPRRSKFAEVLDVKHNPMPGLFSAGELGALWPDVYNGGGNIGECCIFGRIAGKNAALSAQGKFTGAPKVKETFESPKPSSSAPAASAVPASCKDGAYTGKGKGYDGDITLTVTVKDGKVSDIQCDEHETKSVGHLAIPGLIEQAKAGQTQWPDAVSGASYTAKGFQAALADAPSKAA